MNAPTLLTAVAAFAFTSPAFAADVAVANVAISAAAAAQLTVTAQSLNIPVVLVDKNAGRSRAAVRAEAVATVQNYRATDASQFDWIMR